MSHLPRKFVKTIIFDCGTEFTNWKSIYNDHDIHRFFADSGYSSQRRLNENSNGLLGKNGSPK